MNSYKNLQFESSSMWSVWFILVLLVRTTIHNVVFIWIVIILHVLSKQLYSIELNSWVDFCQLVRSTPAEKRKKNAKDSQECVHSPTALNTEANTAHGDLVWAVRGQSHLTSVLEWSLFSQTKYGLHIPAPSASPEEQRLLGVQRLPTAASGGNSCVWREDKPPSQLPHLLFSLKGNKHTIYAPRRKRDSWLLIGKPIGRWKTSL